MPVAAYPFRFTQSLLADRSFRKKSLHEPWLLQPSGSDSETDEETRGLINLEDHPQTSEIAPKVKPTQLILEGGTLWGSELS